MNNIKKYTKGWKSGLPETPCGSGSMLKNTKEQILWIPEIVKKYNIKTIADVGAGDLNWSSTIEWPQGIQYTPYDLVPRKPEVIALDLIADVPPKADLIMCLWVLNHLPYERGAIAMENLKASGSKYLLISNVPGWDVDYIEDLPYVDMLELYDEKGKELRLIEL